MTTTIDSVRALARKRKHRTPLHEHFNSEGTWRLGAGLYLRVREGAKGLQKVWLHRYRFNDKARGDLLGSAYELSEIDAALAVDASNEALAKGHDPRGEKAVAKKDNTNFRRAAEEFFAVEFPVLATDGVLDPMKVEAASKHIKQWLSSVRATYPVLGDLALDQIEGDHVAKALRDDWHRVPETARRTRGRLWQIMKWTIARKLRANKYNPADRGDIETILRSNTKSKAKTHHLAMAWEEVPGFTRELAGQEGYSAIALHLLIRTAKRSSEVLLAHRSEFNLKTRTWTIPRSRMKVKEGAPHQVPLSDATCSLVEPLLGLIHAGPYLFPGDVRGQPLTHMVMLNVIERMGYKGAFTPHGFRTSFKEWSRHHKVALPPTGVEQRELTELSLDHQFGNEVERAYGRDQLLELRRPLLDAWNAHLDGPAGANVVNLFKAA